MKGRDIVIVALQSWDFEIGSNARNIAREFARHNRVMYVNPPLDRFTRIRKRNEEKTQRFLRVINKENSGLKQVEGNIWNLTPDFIAESVNWMSASFFDLFNKRNNQKFADSIRAAMNELGFKDIILFNDNFMFGGLYLKKFLTPDIYCYYIRDYLVVQPYFGKQGKRLEPEIIRTSDVVVANSTYLQEYAAQYNKNSFYVGQGCEVEMFDEKLVNEKPADLANIKYPVIGYVGFLTSQRLDIPLLIHIAEQRPGWNIVLVGPEDDAFKASKLHELKNVFFPGRKKPAELPAYVRYFDVCINPQAINQLTIGNYPRKIDEYLAMGKPTVATNTKAMEIFAAETYLAATPDEYIQQITKALAENDSALREQRVATARSHTWENSVKDIYEALFALSHAAL
ncbi:MAG TPA: glycosyltransferase [Cyclobacteriaceae bacterium]|nr:glycosyltransferase [Cyclobacteriaceae bacterium]